MDLKKGLSGADEPLGQVQCKADIVDLTVIQAANLAQLGPFPKKRPGPGQVIALALAAVAGVELKTQAFTCVQRPDGSFNALWDR